MSRTSISINDEDEFSPIGNYPLNLRYSDTGDEIIARVPFSSIPIHYTRPNLLPKIRKILSNINITTAILRKTLKNIKNVCIFPDIIYIPIFERGGRIVGEFDTNMINALKSYEYSDALEYNLKDEIPGIDKLYYSNMTELDIILNHTVPDMHYYKYKKLNCLKRFSVFLINTNRYTVKDNGEVVSTNNYYHRIFLIIDNDTREGVVLDPYGYPSYTTNEYNIEYIVRKISSFLYNKQDWAPVISVVFMKGPQSCDTRATCTIWTNYLIDKIMRKINKSSRDEDFDLKNICHREYKKLYDKFFDNDETSLDEIDKYMLYLNRVYDDVINGDNEIFDPTTRRMKRSRVFSSPTRTPSFRMLFNKDYNDFDSQATQSRASRSKMSPINSRFASWAKEGFSPSRSQAGQSRASRSQAGQSRASRSQAGQTRASRSQAGQTLQRSKTKTPSARLLFGADYEDF